MVDFGVNRLGRDRYQEPHALLPRSPGTVTHRENRCDNSRRLSSRSTVFQLSVVSRQPSLTASNSFPPSGRAAIITRVQSRSSSRPMLKWNRPPRHRHTRAAQVALAKVGIFFLPAVGKPRDVGWVTSPRRPHPKALRERAEITGRQLPQVQDRQPFGDLG
jgi:hypothetical protein